MSVPCGVVWGVSNVWGLLEWLDVGHKSGDSVLKVCWIPQSSSI